MRLIMDVRLIKRAMLVLKTQSGPIYYELK